MNEMKKRLTDAEQDKLLRKFRATRDPKIRDTLILHNQTLASWQARKSVSYKRYADELEQVAMIGIMRALDKFEPDKGFKFSTYATVWMRHEIQEFFRMLSVVPLSKDDSQKVNAEIRAGGDLTERAEYLNVVRNSWSTDIPAEFGGNVIQAQLATQDDYGEDQAAYRATLNELVPRLKPESRHIIEAKLAGTPISRIAKDLGRSPEYTRQRYHIAVKQLGALADKYGVGNPFED